MSEYWKSTPKYWCKHCSTYVRDTKLERTNHEATAKHQGNLKRFLRDLHRNHEQEQREKDRAKREIDRLNGLVDSTSSDHAASSSTSAAGGRTSTAHQPQASGGQRQKQWEQLAEMGIDVPTELRGDMAMAGEWTVTNTRVIADASTPESGDAGAKSVDGVASGVRKRPKREPDEEEEENAIKGLFKKPKRWGRDTKQAPEDDAELDALLSGTLARPPKTEEQSQDKIKREDYPPIKKEEPPSGIKEEADDGRDLADIKPAAASVGEIPVKQEDGAEDEPNQAPAVVFKKRKPKNIRQR